MSKSTTYRVEGGGVNNFVFLTLRTTYKQRLMNEAAQKQVVFSFRMNNNFSKKKRFSYILFLLLLILNLQMPGCSSSSLTLRSRLVAIFLCFQIKPQLFLKVPGKGKWRKHSSKSTVIQHTE